MESTTQETEDHRDVSRSKLRGPPRSLLRKSGSKFAIHSSTTRSALMPMLSNTTALVTGASSGIGLATAEALAQAGAAVIVHGRRAEVMREVAEQLRRSGADVHVVLADLADPDQRISLIQQAWEWRGRVDIWINNAGVDVLTGEAADWPFERKLDALWQVDVQGTIAISRAVGARMQARPEPHRDATIINMGWDQAAGGMEGDSGEMFAAAKGAVMAFTRSLAKTLAPTVRVNCGRARLDPDQMGATGQRRLAPASDR